MEEVVEELSKKYNRKEKLIYILLKETMNKGYTILESRSIIDEFYKINVCY